MNMKKIFKRTSLLLATALIGVTVQAQKSPQDMDRFIDALMRRMTVEEKIGQLNLPVTGEITTGQAKSSDVAKKIEQGLVGGLFNLKGVAKIRDVQKLAVENSRLGTAYLKYYYPKEFMAALMSSVMDNVSKFSEYILTCRRMMDIAILPPDINEGESGFSVSGDGIRYGLSAIKSVGRPVVDAILEERKKNGIFSSMEDFINRMTNKEVNRRTIENFIKSGAMDSLPGTRRQKVAVAPILLDNKARERKNAWEGQMSLFDLVSEEEKKEYQVSFPDVGEYSKEELLAFEKDILGVYISGHPLDDYEGLWRKNITATSADFIVDEETEEAVVKDGMKVVMAERG